jgi:hypothetical protein
LPYIFGLLLGRFINRFLAYYRFFGL